MLPDCDGASAEGNSFLINVRGEEYVLVNTVWASVTAIVAVSLEDGSIHRMTDRFHSWNLLHARDGLFLAVRSTAVETPQLVGVPLFCRLLLLLSSYT